MRLRVLSVFGAASLQDGGRPGFRRFGVPIGGAFDRQSARRANTLLGNEPDAPVIEFALGTLELEVLEAGGLSFAGASEAILVNGQPRQVDWAGNLALRDQVVVRPPKKGLRTYIASTGGFSAPVVLCSVSGFLIERGLELRSVREGRVRERSEGPLVWPEGPLRVITSTEEKEWLDVEYRVSRNIDRVGLRLDGSCPPVDAHSGRSEPSDFGLVQLTEDGSLIIHGPDGPTIGGYRKLGCVIRADLDRLGQLAPGDALTFASTSREEASAAWHEREKRIVAFEEGLAR